MKRETMMEAAWMKTNGVIPVRLKPQPNFKGTVTCSSVQRTGAN